MKTIGIAAHSVEGGSLCFLTACREGAKDLGTFMHPPVVMSAVPLGLSMPGWWSGDYKTVAKFLAQGVQQVADAGADFYVCPDNTAHIILEDIAQDLPIPGLHIAEVVCREITNGGWKRVGLLGTKWTMTGPVYAHRFEELGLERIIPDEPVRERINAIIFDELCQGIFSPEATELFVGAIEELKSKGAECVVLGCTEIPLVVTPGDSSLPVIDTPRSLARYAVRVAMDEQPIAIKHGWLPL